MNKAQQIKALKEERAAKLAALDVLSGHVATRALTAEETTQYAALETEINGMNTRLGILEASYTRELAAAAEQRGAGAPAPGAGHGGDGSEDPEDAADRERRTMVNKFSFKRALNLIVNKRGSAKDGVEAEFDKMERQLLIESGVSEMRTDSIMVPAEAFERRRRAERRDMTATGGSSGSEGGITIQTEVQGLVDVFLPEMVLGRLPILRMNNLRGNVRFPQAQTSPSAGWNTENGGATEKSPTMTSLLLQPKRLAAYIQLSNQLLIQSEANIGAYARRFLINAAAIELEKAALKGGGANEPTGIIGGTGYSTIYAGDAVNNAVNANGARMVWADFVKLVSSTKMLNSPDGQAYIMSPQLKGRLQITPRQSAGVEGNFILRNWNEGINGFQALATTNLPDTFAKGGSSALSACIFGDFSNFVMGSWGGMEIGVDPYTNMKENMTNIVLNTYMDCGMLNPAGFSVCKDAQAY